MPQWTATEFKTHYAFSGQFGSTADATVESALADAEERLSADAFLKTSAYKKAVGFLAAHLMSTAPTGSGGLGGASATGDITSISIPNEISISYGKSSRDSDGFWQSEYSRTAYGLQLLQIIRSNIVAARIT